MDSVPHTAETKGEKCLDPPLIWLAVNTMTPGRWQTHSSGGWLQPQDGLRIATLADFPAYAEQRRIGRLGDVAVKLHNRPSAKPRVTSELRNPAGHALTHPNVGKRRGSGLHVIYQVLGLAGSGDGARDRRVRDHKFEEELCPG
jgi:hypothetical protein